jgi:hypothetical protein
MDKDVLGASASPSGSRPTDQANLRCPDASRFDPSRIWIGLTSIEAAWRAGDFGYLPKPGE